MNYEDFDDDIDEDILRDYAAVPNDYNLRDAIEASQPSASGAITQNPCSNEPVSKERDWYTIHISSDPKLKDSDRLEYFALLEAEWHSNSKQHNNHSQ